MTRLALRYRAPQPKVALTTRGVEEDAMRKNPGPWTRGWDCARALAIAAVMLGAGIPSAGARLPEHTGPEITIHVYNYAEVKPAILAAAGNYGALRVGNRTRDSAHVDLREERRRQGRPQYHNCQDTWNPVEKLCSIHDVTFRQS